MKPETVALDLIDHDGQPYGVERLAGRFSLLYFGFLHCRAVCPRSLAKIDDTLGLLGQERDNLRVLYVSVDPERDTPEAMKSFLSGSYPAFTGLTGSSDAVDAAKASMKVFTRRMADPEDPQGYAVPHTAIIYLIDDQGDYVTHFADHLTAAEISERLKPLLSA